ncbi:hypothetical protein FH607_010355 [Streptomyces mimosae]|uniref:Uncharacterized protein n=2 Tax=Streptomyces mimosae TaxID=2586635 RepID=A0A5N6AF37_9ACTN|nr:hypothetical protein [Streptomyces sp. 3MP-14]KAB8167271.1 hypothetical protein FH607_010355 [Streptomyces mimosae]
MAEAIAARHGAPAEVTTVTLPSGEAVRCRRRGVPEDAPEWGQPPERPGTIVDFTLPVPGSGGWPVLTFSTPIPELADPLTEMFDAIARSLRWSGDKERAGV